jgi:hypothetical protein
MALDSNVKLGPHCGASISTSRRGIKHIDFLCTVFTAMQHKQKNIKTLRSFPYAYVVAYALSCVVVRTQ